LTELVFYKEQFCRLSSVCSQFRKYIIATFLLVNTCAYITSKVRIRLEIEIELECNQSEENKSQILL